MPMQISFDALSPAKLRAADFNLPFGQTRYFTASFLVERPCIVQGHIHTDLPFKIGAFSANYGGRLRNISIGRYCSIAGDLNTGWDEHPLDWVSSSILGYVQDIHGWASAFGKGNREMPAPVPVSEVMRGLTVVGNDVWIGHGVFIRAGVVIGDGAVVAAGSVVVKDVAPYSIVGGNPARVIRQRFKPDIVERFIRSEWWHQNLLDFPQHLFPHPEAFLDEFERRRDAGELNEFVPQHVTASDLANVAGVEIKQF